MGTYIVYLKWSSKCNVTGNTRFNFGALLCLFGSMYSHTKDLQTEKCCLLVVVGHTESRTGILYRECLTMSSRVAALLYGPQGLEVNLWNGQVVNNNIYSTLRRHRKLSLTGVWALFRTLVLGEVFKGRLSPPPLWTVFWIWILTVFRCSLVHIWVNFKAKLLQILNNFLQRKQKGGFGPWIGRGDMLLLTHFWLGNFSPPPSFLHHWHFEHPA